MKTVLIVTHRMGFEADPVIDLLRKRNIPVFRFNCDTGSDAPMVSFTINSSENNFFLNCDNIEINEKQIGVGWCQQPPSFLSQPSDESQCLQNENLLSACFASLDLLDLPWINRPRDIMRASNKVAQLIFAKKIGFAVPSTLVSNTPNHIRDFAKDNTIIAKNLATPWIVNSEQKTSAAYTKIVASEWLDNDSELHFSPIIYQSFHKRAKDYRVVVIGNQSFAVSCIPRENQMEDIRRDASTGENFVSCDFDQSSLEMLKSLMKEFGVDYCAADFMEDESGKLYFLEMNTCGAWWWVDRFYDGAICNAIVDFIEQGMYNPESS